jgi:hypothetical protein
VHRQGNFVSETASRASDQQGSFNVHTLGVEVDWSISKDKSGGGRDVDDSKEGRCNRATRNEDFSVLWQRDVATISNWNLATPGRSYELLHTDS